MSQNDRKAMCLFFYCRIKSEYIYTIPFFQINIVIHLKNIKCLTKPEPHRTSLIIGVVYRHPGSLYNAFQEEFGVIIRKLSQSNTKLVLVGDYHINLSKQTLDTKNYNYVNDIYSSGCYSLINKPTRITATSATVLVHIYINSLHKIALAGVLTLDILDHLPTFCVIKLILKTIFLG